MRIQNGAAPIKVQPRRSVHAYHGTFGAALPEEDFCVDPNLSWPDQNADKAPNFCVGYTGRDIICDVYHVDVSADWLYMRTLQLMGVGPTTAGSDPHRGMQAVVAFGAPPISETPLSALTNGDLFCANPRNWPNFVQTDAAPYRFNGVGSALGNGDPFTSIITAVKTCGYGVSVATKWFPELEKPDAKGIVQLPQIPWGIMPTAYYPSLGGHNYVVKGLKTIGGVPYAMVKSHQGRGFGDNGWLYFSRETLNYVLTNSLPYGGGAMTLLRDSNRLVSLINIITEDFPQALPQLIKILSV